MARRAAQEKHSHLFAGGILMACGMMYLRLAALVTLFSRPLMIVLAGPFLILALLAIAAGFVWTRIPEDGVRDVQPEYDPKNPLELLTAFLFAAVFVDHAGSDATGGHVPGQGGHQHDWPRSWEWWTWIRSSWV